MAKQKFRPTRLGVFSGAKAYIVYVEVLKKRRNAVGRTFCDAIKFALRMLLVRTFQAVQGRKGSCHGVGHKGMIIG
jgi:hypothetical protein